MARTIIRASYESGGTEYVYQVTDIRNPSIVDATITLAKLKRGNEIILSDGTVAMVANLQMGGNKITNVADGTTSGDVVTYGQLQAATGGLDVKEAVTCATVSALPSYTGGGTGTLTATSDGVLSIDDYVVITGDRVLVKNQNGEAAHVDNGIYVVTDPGDPYNPFVITRSADADQDYEVTHGMFCFVSEGDVNNDSGWVVTTNDPITVNTTPIQFSQFHSGGHPVAGDGLVLNGFRYDIVFSDGVFNDNDSVAANPIDFTGKGLETVDPGDGYDDIQVDLTANGGIQFNTSDNNSLVLKLADIVGTGLEVSGTLPGTLQIDLLASGGLTFAGNELAVEVGDIAGGGIKETPTNTNLLQVDFLANGGITFTTGGATPATAADTIQIKTADFAGDGLTTINDAHAVDSLKIHLTNEDGSAGLEFTGTSPNKTLNLALDSYSDQVLSIGHSGSDGLAIALGVDGNTTNGYILVGNGSTPSLAKEVLLSGDATIGTTGVVTLASTFKKITDFVFNESVAHNGGNDFGDTPSNTYNGTNAGPLANVPATGTLQVFLNGVLQQPGAANDYTLSGQTIQFTFVLKTAPGNPDKVVAHYIK